MDPQLSPQLHEPAEAARFLAERLRTIQGWQDYGTELHQDDPPPSPVTHESPPERLILLVKEVMRWGVCTASPRFMDKLYAGTTPVGALSELICAVLNNNAHVFRGSPILST
jgi:hypothetical protein